MRLVDDGSNPPPPPWKKARSAPGYISTFVFLSVNVAGVNCLNVTEATSNDVMRRVFDINFFGTVRVIQEVLPIMKKQRSGRIINTGSVHGVVGKYTL